MYREQCADKDSTSAISKDREHQKRPLNVRGLLWYEETETASQAVCTATPVSVLDLC